jgi:hypothetical protein
VLLQFRAVELRRLLIKLRCVAAIHAHHAYGGSQLAGRIVLVRHLIQVDRGRTVMLRRMVPTGVRGRNTRQVRLNPVWIRYPIGRLTVANLRLRLDVAE